MAAQVAMKCLFLFFFGFYFIPQSKESKSQKDLCVDELVYTEEKFVDALEMIREASLRQFSYRNS